MAHAGSGRENGSGKIIHPLKEDIIMASNSNDKTGTTAKPSTTQDQQNQQSGKQSGKQQSTGTHGGTQGGTHEQHADAGRQSHKNDMDKGDKGSASQQSGQKGASQQSGSGGNASGGSGSGSSTRGGTPEQHAEAGRQSHKNDDKP